MGRIEPGHWSTWGTDAAAYLAMLIAEIHTREDMDEDDLLLLVLSCAWPTRLAQDH